MSNIAGIGVRLFETVVVETVQLVLSQFKKKTLMQSIEN